MAKENYRTLLPIRTKLLGEEHLNTLAITNTLVKVKCVILVAIPM